MAKMLFKCVELAFVLGGALILLGACSLPSTQSQDASFAPAESLMDKSGLYGPGESIKVGGMAIGSREKPSGDELSIGYPHVSKLSALPEGVARSDFRGGAFDGDSARAMNERLGFSPDGEGRLPQGYSYVLVTESISNSRGDVMSYDLSQGRFALVGDSRSLKYVGTEEPLWHDAKVTGNPKSYWIVSIQPNSDKTVKLLYALPDEAMVDKGLCYVVDPGNASSEKGFVGLKGFDITGQIQG